MNTKIELVLPVPPTINHYYTRTRYSMVVGDKGRAFRDDVYYSVKDRYPKHKTFFKKVSVIIWFTPPDKRKRDLDNILKCLLDSLEYANIYNNDNQITELTLYKIDVRKPGGVKVIISEI